MTLFKKTKAAIENNIANQTSERVDEHLEGMIVQPFAYKKLLIIYCSYPSIWYINF